MRSKLVTAGVWKSLTSTAKAARTPAYVAVAYFGQGASKLLPLPPNSRLVVDASDGAVKSGQTCPVDLRRMQKRGVVIYSAPSLHGKVFVFGNVAFVGSTNVSNRSAGVLIEAALRTTDRQVVRSAKKFVDGLCLNELSPGTIDRLKRIYRPPHMPGGGARAGRNLKNTRPELPRLFMAQLEDVAPPAGSESTLEKGFRIAKSRRKHGRTYAFDYLWWSGSCSMREGDKVVQVLEENSGRHFVASPADILYTRTWRKNGRQITFVYFEHPDVRRISLEKLARRLGYGAKKKLSRTSGLVRNREFAEKLLGNWSQF